MTFSAKKPKTSENLSSALQKNHFISLEAFFMFLSFALKIAFSNFFSLKQTFFSTCGLAISSFARNTELVFPICRSLRVMSWRHRGFTWKPRTSLTKEKTPMKLASGFCIPEPLPVHTGIKGRQVHPLIRFLLRSRVDEKSADLHKAVHLCFVPGWRNGAISGVPLISDFPLGTSTERANSKRANHGRSRLFQDAVSSVSFWLRSFSVCGWRTQSLSSVSGQQFSAVQQQTEAIQHILPRRDAPSTAAPGARPQSARRRGRPPASSRAAPPQAESTHRPVRRASRRRAAPPASQPGRKSSRKSTKRPWRGQPGDVGVCSFSGDGKNSTAPSLGGGPGGESSVSFCFCSAAGPRASGTHLLKERAISFSSGFSGPWDDSVRRPASSLSPTTHFASSQESTVRGRHSSPRTSGQSRSGPREFGEDASERTAFCAIHPYSLSLHHHRYVNCAVGAACTASGGVAHAAQPVSLAHAHNSTRLRDSVRQATSQVQRRSRDVGGSPECPCLAWGDCCPPGKGCNRAGPSSRDEAGVLQPLLHRTQERLWPSANPGSASLEPGLAQAPVQDADAKAHDQMHSAPGLVCSDRPEGRLLSRFDPSATQTVSTVCVRRSGMAVQGPPLRALPVSPCVHEGCRGRPYPVMGSGRQDPQLPRRLAYSSPIQRAVGRSQGLGAPAPQPVGASGQLGKEQALPCAENLFSRCGVRLGEYDGTPHGGTCPSSAELPEFLQRQECGTTETVSEAPGAYGIRSCSHTARIASY